MLKMKKSSVNKVYCLFEQSAHFTDVFKSIGFDAKCYDIDNQFNKTDVQLDLFAEIEKAYNNEPCVLDVITENDLVFSFFPCIRFCQWTQMHSKCNETNSSRLADADKCLYSLKIQEERLYFYRYWCYMFNVAFNRKWKLVVENPYNYNFKFLEDYFPIDKAVLVENRYLHGDYFKKPTQFWFIGFEPIFQFNHYLPILQDSRLIINNDNSHRIERSLINFEFIKWFIQEYIFEDIDFNIRS